MKFPALEEAQGKLDHARKALATAMGEAKTSSPGVYDMDQIKSVSGDKSEKLAWIQAKNSELTELKAEVDRQNAVKVAAESASSYEGGEVKGDNSHEEKGSQRKGVAELFTKSKAFTEKGQRATLDVDLKTLFERSAGWEPESTRSGLVTLKPMVPAPSVFDHLVSMPVTQAAYKYMEETTYTNSASEDE